MYIFNDDKQFFSAKKKRNFDISTQISLTMNFRIHKNIGSGVFYKKNYVGLKYFHLELDSNFYLCRLRPDLLDSISKF